MSHEQAKRQIADIDSKKMNADQWGNFDPSTGIFKPEEANSRIKALLDKYFCYAKLNF